MRGRANTSRVNESLVLSKVLWHNTITDIKGKIGDELGFTDAEVANHLARLESDGYVTTGGRVVGGTVRTYVSITQKGRDRMGDLAIDYKVEDESPHAYAMDVKLW